MLFTRTCGLCLVAFLAVPSAAADPDLHRLHLIRFELDNDVFLNKDSSFTAGGSIQVHSPLDDVWSARWIGRVPGLGDDGEGGRVVRWAAGLTQIIITPDLVTIAEPQPDDAPWAGILGGTFSWSAYDNRRLGALQLYAGCMGPCSGGEAVHKFFHDDLGIGDSPAGWDNQLVNQALANLNYEYRYKVLAASPKRYFAGFAQDLAVGARAGVGNLETFAGAQFEYRFGWGLPMGFAHVTDPPSGILLDPIYGDPGRVWQVYFTLVGRAAYITYLAPAEGGETENGGFHPALRPYPGRFQGVAAFHLVRVPFGVHVTYTHDFEQPSVIEESSDWISLGFEYRF